jgi:glycosyltransferase involved in cell wall biosynthesis
VHWAGEVGAQEKRQLLSRARGLLAPSRWHEPFGLVLVEAMACGTPVVALRRGSVPEIVIDGETGFVLDDERGLAGALGRLAEIDPKECRRHVETTFSVEAMVDGYARLYREAIARGTDARFELAV